MSETAIETPESQPPSEVIKLYRGIWAPTIEDGQLLPVGGSIFNDNLTTNLKVDYGSFDQDLENYGKRIKDHYEANKEQITEWLKKAGCEIDPYLYFACLQAQLKEEELLAVKRDQDTEAERRKIYSGDSSPKLSDLKGVAACAEETVLGKELLKLMGIKSTYMSGVVMADPEEPTDSPEDHSFLIINEPDKDASLIFDIARPKSQHNLPRILRTDFHLTEDVFKGKQHDLVKGVDVLDKKQLYYGVGHPMLNIKHNVIRQLRNQ